MADVVRYYLPSSGAAAHTPTISASWLHSEGAAFLATVTSKISSAKVNKKASVYAIGTERNLAQLYVTPAQSAHEWTTDDAIEFQALCIREENTSSGYVYLVVRVFDDDCSTVKGTLFEGIAPTDITQAGIGMNRALVAGGGHVHVQNAVSMADNDHIVIEIGFTCTATSAWAGSQVQVGDNQASDYPVDETDTGADHDPWIEFTMEGAAAQTISGVGGIASAEAFGTGQLNSTIKPSGIATAEAVDSNTKLNPIILPSGIAGIEVVGTGAKLNSIIKPSGITTREAFGLAVLRAWLVASGIPTEEAFGTAAALLRFMAQTIPSGEVVPTGAILTSAGPGPRTIYPSSIISAEAFGTAVLRHVDSILPTGIPSGEILPGGMRILLSIIGQGIPTAEALGEPTLYAPAANFISAIGIPTGEAFGVPQLNSTIKPSGILTGEAFGTGKLNFRIFPVGIETAEAFGTAWVNRIASPIYKRIWFGNRIKQVYVKEK